MRDDAIQLEEKRLEGISALADYQSVHERHRIFPEIFERRGHRTIIDLSAGVGCTAQRINKDYPAKLICNEISPAALHLLRDQNLETISFDIDNRDLHFPFKAASFDAAISLATIEHLVYGDQFLNEIARILKDDSYLYLSTPNYAALFYIPTFLISGRTFHDPLSASPTERYEFYSHVRYFTFTTLLDYVSSFGFVPETVYLPLPKESTRYKKLYSNAKWKALFFRFSMRVLYSLGRPRWASEPVICFKKGTNAQKGKFRKAIV